MISSTLLPRDRAAALHVDREWSRFVSAWRVYPLTADQDTCLVYLQSTMPVNLLRTRFMLPRLVVVHMSGMLNVLLGMPGIIGECLFSGGEFERMLRRTARDLSADFAAVPVDPPAPPPPEYIDLTADEVIDLSVTPPGSPASTIAYSTV